MRIEARRVYRLGLTVSLALAVGYALALPMPFMPPLFAIYLVASPRPPIGPKGLFALALVVIATTGTGLLLVPLLQNYPLTAMIVVVAGLYLANNLSINLGQGLLGALLTMGLTLISAAGLASFELAITVIQGLVLSIIIAVVCQWVIYPWFPEEARETSVEQAKATGGSASKWLAARAVIIVYPAYFLALMDPPSYMAIVMKAVSLGQQDSVERARYAGRELLGSTLLGGCFAVMFWIGLKAWPSLWMFFLLMLLFGFYFAAKLYGVRRSRFPASFWVNAAVTALIMLGPAVADSANGKDVYRAFAVRMGLFIALTVYASLAIRLLEVWRARWSTRHHIPQPATETA